MILYLLVIFLDRFNTTKAHLWDGEQIFEMTVSDRDVAQQIPPTSEIGSVRSFSILFKFIELKKKKIQSVFDSSSRKWKNQNFSISESTCANANREQPIKTKQHQQIRTNKSEQIKKNEIHSHCGRIETKKERKKG
jgi:hypothetical protein